MQKSLLIINPGSTSTKVAVYDNKTARLTENIEHDPEELKSFPSVSSQFSYRIDAIERWMKEKEVGEIHGVVGRGGLLKPLQGGCYAVDEVMLTDLREAAQGEHASNLGALIADQIAEPLGIPSFIVDPVSVDEFEEVARFSGMKEIRRTSLLHALNIRATAQKAAEEMGKDLSELSLIIAHLGGGISIAPMEKGRMIDVNGANEEGPFSPERTGNVPCAALVRGIYSGEFGDYASVKKMLNGQGGLMAYLGSSDVREATKRMDAGDEEAKLVLDAMAYQIAKCIGSMAAVLKGDVDAILLTGGVAHSKHITSHVEARVRFIAPVKIYPGENEMEALALGALRVLDGRESARSYEEEVKK